MHTHKQARTRAHTHTHAHARTQTHKHTHHWYVLVCARYLKQITVRDIQTNQVWHFVCDGWLTPERGMRGIKRSLYAIEDRRSRMYDFRLRSMQILRREHPWVSIFSRPVYTTFNRAQRLSCVMSFAMIAMLTNIMFYGQPPVQIEEGALGGIAITMDQLIVSIESFLICLPTSIFIVAIFTNARPRERRDISIEFDVVTTKKWVPCNDQCTVSSENSYLCFGRRCYDIDVDV